VTLPLAVGKYTRARYSLLRCQPLTGRYHQIRRHMNYLSHPILGDGDHGDRHHNRCVACAQERAPGQSQAPARGLCGLWPGPSLPCPAGLSHLGARYNSLPCSSSPNFLSMPACPTFLLGARCSCLPCQLPALRAASLPTAHKATRLPTPAPVRAPRRRLFSGTLQLPGMFLRAASLSFHHPAMNKRVTIASPAAEWEPRWQAAFGALGCCPLVSGATLLPLPMEVSGC